MINFDTLFQLLADKLEKKFKFPSSVPTNSNKIYLSFEELAHYTSFNEGVNLYFSVKQNHKNLEKVKRHIHSCFFSDIEIELHEGAENSSAILKLNGPQTVRLCEKYQLFSQVKAEHREQMEAVCQQAEKIIYNQPVEGTALLKNLVDKIEHSSFHMQLLYQIEDYKLIEDIYLRQRKLDTAKELENKAPIEAINLYNEIIWEMKGEDEVPEAQTQAASQGLESAQRTLSQQHYQKASDAYKEIQQKIRAKDPHLENELEITRQLFIKADQHGSFLKLEQKQTVSRAIRILESQQAKRTHTASASFATALQKGLRTTSHDIKRHERAQAAPKALKAQSQTPILTATSTDGNALDAILDKALEDIGFC